MYKKIKRKYVTKFYRCPFCDKIISIDNKYHKQKCVEAVATLLELLEEQQRGAEKHDTEH